MKRILLLFFGLYSFFAVCADEPFGIINVSVCNTRNEADYNSAQESQALLGMPVKILDREREWTKIQTPDEYVHWVLSGSLQRVDEAGLHAWNRASQVVVTALHGFVYQEKSTRSQTVSDVVAGDRLRLIARRGKFYEVLYPDGRRGFILRKISQPIWEWRSKLKRDAQSILKTAYSLNGVPYMWGGTSPKGMDCSGFVRTTLYMHDIIIPRNAAQQAEKGQRVEIDLDFNNLQPGDLLFFGDKRTGRVSHVGFYVGQKRFIHSLGWVHESSFSPEDPNYDEYDLHRLLFASRVLPYINRETGLCTTDQNEYYK